MPTFRIDRAEIEKAGPSVRDEFTRMVADEIAAETENYCRRALAEGPGWRVWRSGPRNVWDPMSFSYELQYSLKLLAPNEAPPGSGIVFGPFVAVPA